MATSSEASRTSTFKVTQSVYWLYGSTRSDKISGLAGDDNLYGNDGNDNLAGGDGNDFLNDGDDTFADVLNGGSGNDRISISEADFAVGGSGVDTLVITLTRSQILYAINLSNISSKKAASIGSLDIKAGQFEEAVLNIYNAADGSSFIGSKGDDRMFVDGSTGSVNGGKGNDSITVRSDLGGFTVDGGGGNDRITGRGSDNKLIGGAGNDIFVISDDATNNTILDSTSNKDRLLISWDEWFGFENADRTNILVSGSDPPATSAKGRFPYDTDDGRLLYDPDGTGAEAAFQVFTLTNKAVLSASSFVFDF